MAIEAMISELAERIDQLSERLDSFQLSGAVDGGGINIKEAADFAGVSEGTMRMWVTSGYVPSLKVKGRIIISRRALDEWLYNLTMKVNRLEMLKANIGLELVSGFDGLQKFFDRKLTDRTLGEFRRQAGILGRSVQNNAKFAHAIVNASFHNATFSDRIWKEQAALKSELDRLLQVGLIQGRNPRVLARDLQKRFGVSQSDAERLMTTELSRVQTEAQKQSYEKNGNEDYTFLTTNPQGPCPVCKVLDGKHFKVKDMKIGVNAPPMHPRCHCTTAPYWDEDEFQKWLEEENRKMHGRMEAEAETNAGSSLIGAIAAGVLSGSNASGKQQAQDLPNTVARYPQERYNRARRRSIGDADRYSVLCQQEHSKDDGCAD